jgi:hypothetical protein
MLLIIPIGRLVLLEQLTSIVASILVPHEHSYQTGHQKQPMHIVFPPPNPVMILLLGFQSRHKTQPKLQINTLIIY